MDAALARTRALAKPNENVDSTPAVPVPEVVLIERAQAGDQQAFEALFEIYYPQIAGYCYRLVGQRELAQDLAQDTFVKAYRALPRTTPDLNLSAWLFTIATNTAISSMRRGRRISWLPLLDTQHAAPSSYEGVESIGERELLEAALARLPRASAACLLLRLHYGFSYEELAPMFGGSVGAVKTRLSRARQAFRRAYRDVAGPDARFPEHGSEEDV